MCEWGVAITGVYTELVANDDRIHAHGTCVFTSDCGEEVT